MNSTTYKEYLQQTLYKEAVQKAANGKGTVDVDPAELILILEGTAESQSISYDDEICLCKTCSQETTVTRQEQYVFNSESTTLEVKCLNCLIDTLSKDQRELQQISAVQWFLKDQGLEEDFELFYEELKSRKES